MAKFNFCPDCGEKKVENASFCVSCGKVLDTSQGSTSVMYALLGAMALSVLVFAVIKFGFEQETTKQAPQSVASQTEKHNHEHSHEDTPKMAELRKLAESGQAAALLDLAEAEIEQSAHDRHYLQGAANTLERLILSYPNHAHSLRLLANIYYDIGETQKAVLNYSRYLTLHPEDANAHTDLGTQYLVLEQFQMAISQYEKALEIFPNFYNAAFNMSVAYNYMGEQELAQSWKEKAAAIEAQHGKTLAPHIPLPRIPEGANAVANVVDLSSQTSSASSSEQAASLISDGIDYSPLKAFFSVHPIVGPKLNSFRAEGGMGIMTLDNFPMDRMPPNVREQLEQKINTMLEAMGPQSKLEIRDAASGRVMANYPSN